ncbi:MAG: type II secretion system protein [Gammaproteobacteria bacterium]|jgi:MSHA pilin protein MshD|nr:type II secretion system protein [Gammaproteobacteria bacterium]MBT5204876.1 type II secretion system protein [Gammaproteobacteria bacterium]MBT5604035.1 type II secretion system protein [Gammaproteobacteria bacterium]MBT6246330.1 type II secretion system protein [Gammaproteobacteria bacterium]
MKKLTPHAGFTLVEMIVVIIILAVSLTAITTILSSNTASSANTFFETRAIELAQAYSDEIMAHRFDEQSALDGVPPCDGLSTDDPVPSSPCTLLASFGGDTDETSRSLYDDVDDYHGLDEGSGSATGASLLNASGTTRTGYENFRVEVSVTYAGDLAPLSAAKTDSKKIVVSISQPNAQRLDFTVYKSNF